MHDGTKKLIIIITSGAFQSLNIDFKLTKPHLVEGDENCTRYKRPDLRLQHLTAPQEISVRYRCSRLYITIRLRITVLSLHVDKC